MKLTDEIRNVNAIEIDEEFIDKVEEVYSCKLPELVKHILSIPHRQGGYEERPGSLRKLGNDMILEASEEMQSDFKGSYLVPIFDFFDNDYLCYDYAKNTWCMYHTVSGQVYNGHENILELLDSLNLNNNSPSTNSYAMPQSNQSKSRVTALLLFFFLYMFGAHFFYLGQRKKALIQIGISILGITFYTIWALQTNFGTQGGSIFYGMSWMLGLIAWIWGLVNTIKLTKKEI